MRRGWESMSSSAALTAPTCTSLRFRRRLHQLSRQMPVPVAGYQACRLASAPGSLLPSKLRHFCVGSGVANNALTAPGHWEIRSQLASNFSSFSVGIAPYQTSIIFQEMSQALPGARLAMKIQGLGPWLLDVSGTECPGCSITSSYESISVGFWKMLLITIELDGLKKHTKSYHA